MNRERELSMYKEFRLVGSFMLMVIVTLCVYVYAQEGSIDEKAHSVIQQELQKRTIQSGTLDLYDEEINKVRNLRIIKEADGITERDGKYFSMIEYRDINEGDIVSVEVEVSKTGDDLSVQTFRIKDVQPLNEGESQEAKEYTDEEVQIFIKEYLKRQTQFNDGKLMLFDKDVGQMRNLELIKLSEEVRRLGVYMSSSSQFKDVDSGEVLDIDISVEIKNGKLSLQALRIRDVHKGE